EPCTGGRDRFEEVWNEEVRERVGAAFVATGVPDAEHTWTSIEPELDAYARAWVTMHREACEATRVRGEQSEDLLDRRMVCLEKRRRELFELVALFADADAELVRRARSIAGKQSRLEPCADAEALLGGVAPPDPEQRDRVLTAEATLKRVMMFRDAGRI